MFTGIVKEIGVISRIEKRDGIISITANSKKVVMGLETGDSIAVNGVCLTAVKVGGGKITFEVMEETARHSTLAHMKEGNEINLESSMRADGVFGGHFVQGHIDCIGKVLSITRSGSEFSMTIGIPEGFDDLYIDKGSVALDGVSLTIGKAGTGKFDIYLIPHTLEYSTLGKRKAGDRVNVEFDVIGKYIAGAMRRASPRVTEKFLEDKGFI